MTPFHYALLSTGAFLAITLWLSYRYLYPFFSRIAICLTVLAVASLFVSHAGILYSQKREGGFKFGVDLVGGTILVYEVDTEKEMKGAYKDNPELLAASLKRRIDPADLYNVTIRPVGSSPPRVEIILPTGGPHQSEGEEQRWEDLIQEVSQKYPPPAGEDLDVGLGRIDDLKAAIKTQHPDLPITEINQFIDEHYQTGRRHLTEEEVQKVKELIANVGSLEFRILANTHDDNEAIEAARKYFENAQKDPKVKVELEARALKGLPPPGPAGKFTVQLHDYTGKYSYKWVELGRQYRHELRLNNDAKGSPLWEQAAQARAKGEAFLDARGNLLYSREVANPSRLPPKDRGKDFEYYVLTRDPEDRSKEITGDFLTSASEDHGRNLQLAVGFHFNTEGGNRFRHLTSVNAPEGKSEDAPGFKRQLAIILDDQVVSAPTINHVISTDGVIEGSFTKTEVDRLVNILRSGALPATLKPQPVSENTMGPTLGADTINKGVFSVGIAFAAILIFMLVYYEFAGLVACVALLANLLFTVGFMVAVQATFTLPGLAGLVLMLGMAVDANVLIYERLREERDRGASLPLAIRNGYDRAFPTIIDTHLSSIFTAIVLYAVGNDQLKGFGVSLTVGLFISLFTSLYMTRLMFDIWMAKNWLHKLSMRRFFSRPSINFMRIRYYWFTATILLTLIGITVFVVRGKAGLNIDFVGGTAYGGELDPERIKDLKDIGDLRKLLSEDNQKKLLQVADVKEDQVPGKEGLIYDITYVNEDGTRTTRTIQFPNKPEKGINEVRRRAEQLPDLSVEQIFLSSDTDTGNLSRHFTIRTSENAPELVQASITRLLGDRLKRIEMEEPKIDKDGKTAELAFRDPSTKKPVYASPGQVTMLLEREFEKKGIEKGVAEQFDLLGQGKSKDGRFQKMQLKLRESSLATALPDALKSLLSEFKERPQPERLETFDSQLATETQTRAMYAILASWAATLLYLWFRFGNWTFGLATVLCLMHDLFFTMGIIAFCHYIHEIPWLAGPLLVQDFKIDLPAVAALLTLVGYSVNDTIVVFDRIREVRGKNPALTPQMINDSVNQTLSRTLLTSFSVWLVVIILYVFGGEGVHLFAFVMVVGVIVGTYSSIYIASPLLLIFGEGSKPSPFRQQPEPQLTAEVTA